MRGAMCPPMSSFPKRTRTSPPSRTNMYFTSGTSGCNPAPPSSPFRMNDCEPYAAKSAISTGPTGMRPRTPMSQAWALVLSSVVVFVCWPARRWARALEARAWPE